VDGAATLGCDLGPAPFVGREYELGELRAALAGALAGRGRAVLVGGEPGIGKTRLAGLVASEAAAPGAAVWSARCWEDGTAPPFWPWNAALRRWVEDAGDDTLLDPAGPFAGELSRVFTVLRERLPSLPAASEWESDQARFRLFDTVSRFLADIARPAGLVVVLDDVQWADGPSLKLLEFVAADLPRARLLVIATYRDSEVRRDHPLLATLSSLAREASTQRLGLTGLAAADCVRYVGMAGAHTDRDALGTKLHEETGGNPFFLGEIVRLLASEGRLASTWDPRLLPADVRAVVARRLDRLGAGCRAALAVGALLGDSFDVGHFEMVLAAPTRGEAADADVPSIDDGSPIGDVPSIRDVPSIGDVPTVGDVPSMVDLLERAVRDRVLIESDGRYAFAHALIRRVVLDDIEPSRRATWHARIAATIERATSAQTDAVAGELVRHFASAGTMAGLRKALAYACRGAEHAARDLGWEESARLYAIALDVGARSGALDDVGAVELRLALADALRRSGDVTSARTQCGEATSACRTLHRPDLLARAALIYAGPVPDFYCVDVDARAALEEACRNTELTDDVLRARLQARLASDIIAANEIDQLERAAALGDAAAAAARRAGDSGALARAQFAGFYLAALGTKPRTSGAQVIMPPTLSSLQGLLEAAEAAGDFEFAAEIRHTRTVAMFALGEADAYRAEHEALATVAAASRVPEALWLADAIAAMRATVEGRFAEGRRLSDRALATGLRMQLTNAAGVHLGQQIMWHAVQGRLAELLPLVSDFIERHPRAAVWRPFCGLARLAQGDVIGARAEFRSLIAAGLTPAKRGVNLRSYLAGLGALCVGLRDHEHAPQLLELVTRRPEPWTVDGCMSLGPWALLAGSLARVCGRPAEAAARFEEAILLGQRMRSRPVVAQAQSLLVAVQLAGGTLDGANRTRAFGILAEAEQAAHELDLVDVMARVEHLRAKLPRLHRAAATNVLRRDGDIWMVRYGGTSLRVKDARGLHYLAALLAVPGRELHVLELAGVGRTAPAVSMVAGGLPVAGLGMALDDTPDARARAEYGARVDELRGGLDEAERFGDVGRAEHLRAELDQLMTELATRFRSRTRVHGPAESARKAVTKALRAQLGHLLAHHPALGRHLHHAVRMGTACVYAPTTRIDWET